MGVGIRAISSRPSLARRRNTLLKPPSASLEMSGQWSCCITSPAIRWSSVGRNLTYRSRKRPVSLNLRAFSRSNDKTNRPDLHPSSRSISKEFLAR
jgi:hypothetical protein